MKKIFSNSRLIAIAFFTVFTATTAHAMPANNGKELPVELKYLGSINNQVIFQLNISGNALQNEFSIIISDEYGNSIYRENIKGENFSKKFLLDTEELGDDSLQLKVLCRKTNRSVVYQINRQTHFAQEIIINELK